MSKLINAVNCLRYGIRNKKGMELVQVAILIAIAVAVGIIFKTSNIVFVKRIFGNLDAANF
ncbi:MAG: hypothetical protein IJI11_02595 [Mogibacterium sp.]|nr:hypothetical protein [Mogibacterium sp.]